MARMVYFTLKFYYFGREGWGEGGGGGGGWRFVEPLEHVQLAKETITYPKICCVPYLILLKFEQILKD